MDITEVIDLSQPLFDGCPGAPGHPSAEVGYWRKFPEDNAMIETLRISSHTGSHVDAPLHLLEGGRSLDDYRAEDFIGIAVPVDLTDKEPDEPIVPGDFAGCRDLITEARIVLLCTGWGEKREKTEMWVHHSPWLSLEAAELLVACQVKGVGVDHFTIGTTDEEKDRRCHEVLLSAGIWIVEDLRLPAELFRHSLWHYVGVPLRLQGGSGAPARPVVFQLRGS